MIFQLLLLSEIRIKKRNKVFLKMSEKKGFTLLEVLISLLVSSFIMFGMMQMYHNLQNFVNKNYLSSKITKQVYQLFSLLDKDLSTSFFPNINNKNKSENKPGKKINNKTKERVFFLGEIIKGEETKKDGKKLELFKNVRFVTTNSFKVYNEKTVHYVLVGYFLEKNKELSSRDKAVYNLYRKETTDLSNYEFQNSDVNSKNEKKEIVKTFLLAENIKHFSIEYHLFDTELKNKNDKNKLVTSFEWGNKDETQNILPNQFRIDISFWDDKFLSEENFGLNINSYSKKYNKNKSKKEAENKDKTEKKGAETNV